MGLTKPVLLQVGYEAEIDLWVISRCSECNKSIEVKDIICIEDHVMIKVEPHNCK